MQKKQIKLFLFFLAVFSVFSLLISDKGFCEINQPKTMEESKGFFEKAVNLILERFPGKIKEIWQNEILPVWQKMGNRVSNIWNRYLGDSIGNFWKNFLKPKISRLLDEIRIFLGKTIEEKKPQIEEELEKEKEELKKEIPTSARNYTEKFRELLK